MKKGNVNATVPTSSTALLGRRMTDAYGLDWVNVYATVTATAGVPFMVQTVQTATQNPGIRVITTNTAAAQRVLIGVPEQSIPADETGWVQVKGPVAMTVTSAAFTAGDGVGITDGVPVDSGQAFNHLNTEFAVVAASQAAAATTVLNCILLGEHRLTAT